MSSLSALTMTAQLGRRRWIGHYIEFSGQSSQYNVDIEEYSDWQRSSGRASGTKIAKSKMPRPNPKSGSQVPDDSLSCIWPFRPVWPFPYDQLPGLFMLLIVR